MDLEQITPNFEFWQNFESCGLKMFLKYKSMYFHILNVSMAIGLLLFKSRSDQTQVTGIGPVDRSRF